MIFNLRFVSVLPNAISLRYQTSALDTWRVSARSVMKATVGVVTKKANTERARGSWRCNLGNLVVTVKFETCFHIILRCQDSEPVFSNSHSRALRSTVWLWTAFRFIFAIAAARRRIQRIASYHDIIATQLAFISYAYDGHQDTRNTIKNKPEVNRRVNEEVLNQKLRAE